MCSSCSLAVAEALNISPATVSRKVKIILKQILTDELKDKRIFPFMQKEIEKRIKLFRKKFNVPETPIKQPKKNKPQPQIKVKYRYKI